MFERAEGLINHWKWQCRRMVEGGDKANHYAYKSYTERYLKWLNMCKNANEHVCQWLRTWTRGVVRSTSFNHAFQWTCDGKGTPFLPPAAVYFHPQFRPNTVALFVLEQMPSRKCDQSHSVRDALVYRHSLPVDSTPSHGLSISPFLSMLLILSFTATWQIHSPLTSHHSARAPVSFPPKIKKKKKINSHSCANLSISNITRSYLIPQPHNLLEGACLPATWAQGMGN